MLRSSTHRHRVFWPRPPAGHRRGAPAPRRGRRIVDEVIDLSSPFVGPSVDETLFQQRPIDVKLNNCIDRPLAIGQKAAERFRLGHRPREAIQKEARLAVFVLDTLVDEPDHGLVRDQTAPNP